MSDYLDILDWIIKHVEETGMNRDELEKEFVHQFGAALLGKFEIALEEAVGG